MLPRLLVKKPFPLSLFFLSKVKNGQLKGMINSTVIHSCSLCFNYCRWWLSLISKKNLIIAKKYQQSRGTTKNSRNDQT